MLKRKTNGDSNSLSEINSRNQKAYLSIDAGEGSSGSPEHGFTKTKSLISKNKSMAFERIKRNGSKVSSSQNSPPSSSH